MNLIIYRHLSIACSVMRDGLQFMVPNKDRVEACREIMESASNSRVIMLTASTEEDAVMEAVVAGGTGLPSEGVGDGVPPDNGPGM